MISPGKWFPTTPAQAAESCNRRRQGDNRQRRKQREEARAAAHGILKKPITLPDLLRNGLDVVFVGINPSLYSAAKGHYFARPGNRFWPCFSRSALSRNARDALAVSELKPEHDRALLDFGFGFTDLVKRATAKASEVAPAEFACGVRRIETLLAWYRPRFACFHGITGYRHFHAALGRGAAPPRLGLQPARLGETSLFLLPSPSGANAHFSRAEQTQWYDRLAACLAEEGG
jgi:TDG/mug DNA glycosylase family protein